MALISRRFPASGSRAPTASPPPLKHSASAPAAFLLPADWWRADHGHLDRLLPRRRSRARRPARRARRRFHLDACARLRRQPGERRPREGDRSRCRANRGYRAPPLSAAAGRTARPRAGLRVSCCRWFAATFCGSSFREPSIGVLGALFPIAMAIVVDSIIPGSERALLVEVGVALAILATLTFAFSVMRDIAMLRIDGRTDLVLQGALWDRLLNLPATFFSSYSAGELSQRVRRDRQSAQGAGGRGACRRR